VESMRDVGITAFIPEVGSVAVMDRCDFIVCMIFSFS
jgi:hypothetical protein